MIVRRLLAGVLLAGLAVPTLGAEPAAVPSAEPSPAASAPATSGPAASMPSPEIAARARAVFDANRAGKIDRSAYSTEMSAKITDAGLARVAAELRALGDVKSFVQVRKITMGTLVAYVFRIETEKPPVIEETISWDAAGKIDLLQFGPAR
jgi:hypothetical protein